jgi:hypothetical protein
MSIARYIYDKSDLENEIANIYVYISPVHKSQQSNIPSFTLYVQALALNEGMFSVQIRNVESEYLEAACMLVLNTLHMYYLPFTYCKDTIDNNTVLTPVAFETMKENLTPHVLDTCDLSGWYTGTIQKQAHLTFEWERPPFHVADVSNTGYLHTSAKASFDEDLINSMQYYRQQNLEKAPIGFSHPFLQVFAS